MLLILMLTGDSAAQTIYVFDHHSAQFGWISYLYIASLTAVNLLLVYSTIYCLAPHFLLRNKFVTFFVALLGSIVFFVAVKSALEYSLFAYLGRTQPSKGVVLVNYATEIIVTTIFVSSSMISFLLRMWSADNKRIMDMEGQKLKSSIDEFKEQIDPNLLFRIIQHASEQVKQKPHKASEVIMCLSDLLRYELYDCKRAKVILKSDIDFVRNYLSLVRQVAGDFSYSISIEGNMNCLVHPFLFMPFIHDILNQSPNEISLNYVIDKSTITLNCKNGDGLSESSTINYNWAHEK